jgi:hypothetical protein
MPQISIRLQTATRRAERDPGAEGAVEAVGGHGSATTDLENEKPRQSKVTPTLGHPHGTCRHQLQGPLSVFLLTRADGLIAYTRRVGNVTTSRVLNLPSWLALLASGASIVCGLWVLWHFFWRIPALYRSQPSGVHSLTTYRPRYSGAPDGVVALNGGGAFYFERGNSSSSEGGEVRAGIVTDGDQLREYGIPTKDEFESVAVGPAGTLWATTILGSPSWPPIWHSAIVRLTGNRMTTAFRIPDSLGYSPALVVAPDGGFWFALPDVHAVGYKAQRGKLSVIVLPTAIKPNTIALNSSGNLYAAESGQRTIFRVSPDRTIHLLTSPSRVGALAAGRSDQVWFTEPGTNRIAHIMRANQIEEVAVGSYVVLDAIAIGSDSVWFAVQGGVGRFSLSKRKSGIINLPDRDSWPISLAIANTGTVWIAEHISDGRCLSPCGGVAQIVP